MKDNKEQLVIEPFVEWPEETLDVDDDAFAAAIQHGRELARAS